VNKLTFILFSWVEEHVMRYESIIKSGIEAEPIFKFLKNENSV